MNIDRFYTTKTNWKPDLFKTGETFFISFKLPKFMVKYDHRSKPISIRYNKFSWQWRIIVITNIKCNRLKYRMFKITFTDVLCTWPVTHFKDEESWLDAVGSSAHFQRLLSVTNKQIWLHWGIVLGMRQRLKYGISRGT